jgi:hypothetical protein
MNASETRPEVILAALLYLVTAYRRNRCPGLAACIARHFQCLATHPRAGRVICEVASASIAEWDGASRESHPLDADKQPPVPALH